VSLLLHIRRIAPATSDARPVTSAPRAALLGTLTFLMLFVPLTGAPSAQAASAPRWEVHLYGAPTNFEPGGTATFVADVLNLGSAPARSTASAPIVLRDTLPAGVTLASGTGYEAIELFGEDEARLGPEYCSESGSEVSCTFPASYPAAFAPGEAITLILHVSVTASEGTTLTDSLVVSGGGAPGTSASTSDLASSTPAAFGFHKVEFFASDAEGHPYTQAGGHPYALTTTFFLNTVLTHSPVRPGENSEAIRDAQEPKDVYVDLPPGMIGNPDFDGSAGKCTLAELWVGSETTGSECPASSQIGTITVLYAESPEGGHNSFNFFYFTRPIYNMVPAPGNAAQIGYTQNNNAPLILSASLRSGSDYGVRIASLGLPEVTIKYVSVTTWGVPHDPSHTAIRGRDCSAYSFGCNGGGLASDSNMTPYLRMQTSCTGAPLPADIFSSSWPPEHPAFAREDITFPATTGCAGLHFQPKIQARPTTNLPDQPSGLDVDLHLKQENTNPEGTATADLKDAAITLPQGMKLNPSAANGLTACSEAEIGYKPSTEAPVEFNTEPTHCPDASKIGTVEVLTPLLEDPLPNPGEGIGALYLAKPHENPFGSLLAAYLVIEDPKTGVQVKLAGKVEADPQTGQLTTRFEESPQAPFEDLKVHIFGGAEGSFRTPSICGTYKSTAVLTPWSAPESGPPVERFDEFEIGGSCAASESSAPNAPAFDAGTESPQAGKFSPFAFKLTRPDGSQEFSKIETLLPPGLTGKLAGIAECPEAAIAQAKGREHDGGGTEELASPSCPAASELGTVEVGAGAGPDPYYTAGHAYLAGAYEGAPLSLVTVVPAVAGPFDLGAVVTRAALHVDPFTAQIKAVSDPLPRIIEGIPLDLRSIVLKLNRPNFTLNPTSCNPMSIGGSATSVFGQPAPLSQRFQVGGCNALPFKPKLAIQLKGGTKRSKFPALKATLKMKPGEANVAAAQVTLPHSAFLANAHINKTCGHPELLAHTCPATSVYGRAEAWSPLLDKPLEGNVYLATGFGYELPALVADLSGQIEVDLVGKVDTGREDGIRNTFEVVPDAPVSKFVLEMAGGKKGLIENSQDLCAKHAKRKALAEFTGQNGKVFDTEPVVKNGCKHRGRHHKKG